MLDSNDRHFSGILPPAPLEQALLSPAPELAPKSAKAPEPSNPAPDFGEEAKRERGGGRGYESGGSGDIIKMVT